MQVIDHPSPNFGPRRGALTPSLIVLHYTAMKTAEDALERLCDPVHEVSAHYLIHRDGRLFQMVREEDRAWHAGAGTWGAQGDINSRSIGIELDNNGRCPFSEPQLSCLETLLPQIMQRWSIAPQNVIGHSDMAPSRKCDPGRKFPWTRLAKQNLAISAQQLDQSCVLNGDQDAATSPSQPIDDAQFMRYALGFGYPEDSPIHATLDALRQRFRPWAHGPLDKGDMELIRRLATRYPVDASATLA